MEPFHADWFGQYKYDSTYSKYETTTVRCHKHSWIYLTSTYYWWLWRPTITIRFDSKFQIIAQLFDSKWKNTIRRTALILIHGYSNRVHGIYMTQWQERRETLSDSLSLLHHGLEVLDAMIRLAVWRTLCQLLLQRLLSIGATVYQQLVQKMY